MAIAPTKIKAFFNDCRLNNWYNAVGAFAVRDVGVDIASTIIKIFNANGYEVFGFQSNHTRADMTVEVNKKIYSASFVYNVEGLIETLDFKEIK